MDNVLKVKSNKYLLKLTIPVFVELLLGTLIGTADQYMISKKSADAYNAIGNSNQMLNVLILTFNVVAMASTILISQYIGAGDTKKCKHLYSLSVFVNVIFGVAVSLILVFFNAPIFRWLNFTDGIYHQARIYVTIVGGGMFLHALTLTFSAFFKANGLMKESMYVSIVMNIINVFGNALLLYGWFGLPQLGIVGVAIPSVISKLVGLIMLIRLYKKQIKVKLSFKELTPFPFKSLKKMLGIGVPSAGEAMSFNFAMLFIQKIINKLGESVISARNTVAILSFISWIFASAISATTQVIIGYLMGAGKIEDVQKRYYSSLKIAMLCSFIGSVILYSVATPLCSIFISDAVALKLCKQILFIDIFLEQGRAINMTTVRSLQACGDTKFPIMLGMVNTWLVAVLGGFILGGVLNYGVLGVWVAMAADELIRGVIFSVRWKRGKWKTMKLATS